MNSMMSYTFRGDFVGRVFKVTHDKQRGPLSLVRVFNGSLKKGAKITTANGSNEIVQRIYDPLADEYREIDGIDSGNIGVCAGLKVSFGFLIYILILVYLLFQFRYHRIQQPAIY